MDLKYFFDRNPDMDDLMELAFDIQKKYDVNFHQAFDIAFKMYQYIYPSISMDDINECLCEIYNYIKQDNDE